MDIYDIVIDSVISKLNLKPKKKIKLGSGSQGVAYLIDDKVYKLTMDKSEYTNSKKLIGHNFNNIAKIYKTYYLSGKIGDLSELYLIVLEHIKGDLNAKQIGTLDYLSDNYDYEELFNARENEYDDLDIQFKYGYDFMDDIIGQLSDIYDNLKRYNIRTDDLFYHENYGVKNGQLVFFDIGYGVPDNIDTNDNLDLNESTKKNINSDEVTRYLNYFGFKLDDYWSSGAFGDAYIRGNIVLKLTTDRSEVMLAKRLLGKSFKHIAEIKQIKFLKKLNCFAIILERLKPLPTEVARTYHNIQTHIGDRFWLANYIGIGGLRNEYFNKIKKYFGSDSNEFMLLGDAHSLYMELNQKDLGIEYLEDLDIHIDNMGVKNGNLAIFDISNFDHDENEINDLMANDSLNENQVADTLKKMGGEAIKYIIKYIRRIFKDSSLHPLERIQMFGRMFAVMSIATTLTIGTFKSIIDSFNSPEMRKELIQGYESVKDKIDTKIDIDSIKFDEPEISVIDNDLPSGDVIDKSFNKFLDTLAFKESSRKWDVINRYNYMGLYQIGSLALKDISQRTSDPELKNIHKKVTPEKFREDPNIFPVELQNKAILQLLRNNKHYLRRYLKKYVGSTINGIKITESGLLAASHLVGNGSVKKFLKSNGEIDPTDGNNVKCSYYLKLFSEYEVDL